MLIFLTLNYLKILENFICDFPNTWVDGNSPEADYKLVNVQHGSSEFMTVYTDFISKMRNIQLKELAVRGK